MPRVLIADDEVSMRSLVARAIAMDGHDIVTAEDVRSVPPGGEVTAAPGAIVTPWAREMAASRGVRIVHGPARTDGQVVALGADHGGFALKEEIKTHLTRLGYRFHDLGTFSTEPVDYPDIALAVARAVRAGDARLAVCLRTIVCRRQGDSR